MRDLVTQGYQEQTIVQQGSLLEARDDQVANRINLLRRQALDKLNELLEQRGIERVLYGDEWLNVLHST